MNNTGWYDPTWSALYGTAAAAPAQAAPQPPQDSPFIVSLQQAAQANVPLELLSFDAIDAVQQP